MATPKIVLLSISSRRISKRPICFNLAPPQSRRTRDPDMLSAVGLSDIDCPCGQDKKSRHFYSDHQSTLVAIGIGRHVRVGSKCEILSPSRCLPLCLRTRTLLDAVSTSHLAE